jgi:hypothetical protein
MMNMLLHVDHTSHAGIFDRLGDFGRFLDEVVWHGFLDTVKLVLVLFLTYLLMEFIEHKASEKARGLMTKAGDFGPAIGGVFGAVPQCGFSAAAANLYTGRVITLGTLIAVFLSTSDEMLPLMVAGNIKLNKILLIILYKTVVGIAMGFAIDLALRLMKVEKREINIDEICDNDECHCERGILFSALHHTLSVSLFIFAVTVLINTAMFFIGYDSLSSGVLSIPVVSHLISGVVGLIPNCASSVALTRLAMSGVISTGAMMSGLFAGAGVGLLVLFKMNRHLKENVIIVALLLGIGLVFGLFADLIGLSVI